MKGIFLLNTLSLSFAILLLSHSTTNGQAFSTGNVVVLQVGDGSAAPTNASTALYLKEYNTTTASQSSPVNSVALPATGAARITTSGSATSEGQITLSADSTKIVIPGYDTSAGISGIASTASASYARAIDTVNRLGNAGRAAATNSQFSGNNIRSATAGTGNDFWGVGGNSGTYYFGNTASAATVQTSNTNTRVIKAMNGNLYYSTASGSTLGIYKITGLPVIGATPAAMIVTGAGSSPYSFAINSAETIAYIADDRNGGSGGGIQKWIFSGSAWTIADTLSVGSGANGGARGLVADFGGTSPTIYVTTTDNRLVKVIDSGTITTSFVTLATAPANTSFRGVVFSPRCIQVPSVSLTPANLLCNGGSTGAVTASVTGAGPFTYAWTGPSSFTSSNQNISGLAAGTYNLTVTGAGGCTNTASTNVTQPTTITTSAASNSPICVNDTLKLNSTPAGGTGALTVLWAGPSAYSSILASPRIPSAQLANAGKYKITVTDANNCTRTDSFIVVVNTSLSVNIGNDTSICSGKTLSLNAGNAGSTYVWNTGVTTQTLNVFAANKYYVTVTNSQGCKGADTIVVAIDTLPKVMLGKDTTICEGKQLVLNAQNAGGIYTWSTGDATQTINAGAAGVYFVTVKTANGCVNADTIKLSLNPLPKADNIISTQVSSNFFFFTVNNPSNVKSYLWLFGDGKSDVGAFSYYKYKEAGTYTVKLVMMSDCGNDTLSTLVTQTTGIDEFKKEALSLYPSPVQTGGTLHFNVAITGSVYDMTGREIKHFINATTITIDDFVPGVYLLREEHGAMARFSVE